MVIRLIDRSNLVSVIQAIIESGYVDPETTPRPRVLSIRTFLVGLLLVCLEGRPAFHTEIYDALFLRIDDPQLLAELEISKAMRQSSRQPRMLRRLERTLQAMSRPLDIDPYPAGRRIERTTLAQVLMEDNVDRSPQAIAERREALCVLINYIVQAAVLWVDDSLAESLRSGILKHYDGSIVIDGMYVETHAAPVPVNGKWLSTEPQAGWARRDNKVIGFRHEIHNLRFAQPDPLGPNEVPPLIGAISPLCTPGTEIGENGFRIIKALSDAGFRKNLVIGDRAYHPGSDPEVFQGPIRMELGYHGFVSDYRKDQLGEQGDRVEGLKLVDGFYYCPEMFDSLVTAERDFRRDEGDPLKIDKATRDNLMSQRTQWAARPKAQWKPGDPVERLMCPAAGDNPTIICAHKPLSSSKGVNLNSVPNPPAFQAPCCRQESVSIPVALNVKYRARFPFESKERETWYAHWRNAVEGGHRRWKSLLGASVGNPDSAWAWGTAAQSILMAFQTLAENIRIIDSFVIDVAEGRAGPKVPIPRGRPPKRRAKAPDLTLIVGEDADDSDDAEEAA